VAVRHRRDTVDSRTSEFGSKVAWLAEQIKHDKGLDWHQYIKAFEASPKRSMQRSNAGSRPNIPALAP
jgi:hypothetical protein